ncbi:MAG: hypothetical protein QOD69_3002 [Solirubrobacteraceae bacterium]|nr:hypothetical protein [Solirubrobacteraceae bacterium]
MASEVPVQPSEPQAPNLTGTVLALSGLTLSAGTIHVVATVQHLDVRWTLPFFFAVVGSLQLGVAWAVYRRPRDRRLLAAAAAGSLVVGVLWLISRTVGLPFGPEQGRSAIGVSDTIASLQEFAFAAIALGIVRAPETTERRLAWLASPMGLRCTFMVLSATLFTAAIGGHRH